MALPRFVLPLATATIGVDLDTHDVELTEYENDWWLAVICTLDDERKVTKAFFFKFSVPTSKKGE